MKNLLKIAVVAGLFCLSFAYSQDEPPCDGASGKLHPNGGSFVADTATIPETAYVNPDSEVCDLAQVGAFAWIDGQKRIGGNDVVLGDEYWRIMHLIKDQNLERETVDLIFCLMESQGPGDELAPDLWPALVGCLTNGQNQGDTQVYGEARVYSYEADYDSARMYGPDAGKIPGDFPAYDLVDHLKIPGDTQVYEPADHLKIPGDFPAYDLVDHLKIPGDTQVYEPADHLKIPGDFPAYDLVDHLKIPGDTRVYGDE